LFLIAAAAAVGVKAQTVPATTAPTKVAVIDTDMFSDEKAGIKRLLAAFQQLDARFKPQRDEIAGMITRYEALAKEVNSPAPGVTQQQLAAKAEQAQTLQTDIKRKQEDARVAYTKQAQTITQPVQQAIYNALEAFAKARGIDILLDASKSRDSMLVLNNAVNITTAFIADYNAKNP
jgi:outer membrane protein